VDVADALVALGGAFLAAGLIARVGRRIELPTIPLFMVAGIIFGPETPGIALFDSASDLEVLAALGLVFLLFYIGLEFSVEELTSGGRSLALAGAAYLLFNVGGGLLFGLALGWGGSEALIFAGILGISSSAIVSKLLVELGRVENRETPLILGIIIIEDVFLALYLALLSPVLGDAQGAGEVIKDIVLAFGLLIVFVAIARFGARLVVKIVDAAEDELFIVCFIGLALLVSGLSEELGVKYAIGALMIGIIMGSTTARERMTHFVHPLRDAFGALFFFWFGLTIAPGDVISVIGPVLAAVALTFLLNFLAGIVAARIRDLDRQAAADIGLTLVSRGEFALVLAALAAGAGLDERLAPFVAGYVLLLAILGPLAATRSTVFAPLIPARLFAAR
jgi:CPA2 family monovalent cation:H+ antiporter-2